MSVDNEVKYYAGDTLPGQTVYNEVKHIGIDPISGFNRSADYLIYKDGGTIYALNGSTGDIDKSDSDAATVIQWVFDNMAVGSVVSVRGILTCTSPLTVNKAFVLKGGRFGHPPPDVSQDTLDFDYDSGDPAIKITSDTFMAQSGIRDLQIDMTDVPDGAGRHGIQLVTGTESMADMKFENVIVWKAADNGIHGEGISCHNIWIRDCVIERSAEKNIRLQTGSRVDNTWITGCMILSAGDYGISLQGGVFRVFNNQIKDSSGVYGMQALSADATIYGNNICANAGDGISVHGDTRARIFGNRIYDNTGSGIFIGLAGGDYPYETIISDNHIIGSASQTTGVTVPSGSDDTIINGNSITGHTTTIDDGGIRTVINGLGKGLGDPSASIDSGTAESGTANTLTDTDKAWTADQWIDYMVRITGGTGSGQERMISDNTADTLTVSSDWDTIPDSTSTYEIVNEWNGHGIEGGNVRDTANSDTYIYNDGSWSQIAAV